MFPLTCIHPRLFQRELPTYGGDAGCEDVCLASNVMELDSTGGAEGN